MYNPPYNPPYGNPRRSARHWIGIGFLVVFAVFVGSMIYFMSQYGPNVAPAVGYYWFPFGFLWVFFLFFLFFAVFRWLLFPWRWGGYYRGYGYGHDGRPNEAYHILRERYARGEITKAQYDQMMRDLYPQPPQTPPP